MGILKLLLLTLLPAIVLGSMAGVIAGKHKVKKEAGQVRYILSKNERILYLVSILVGISCIMFGIFYTPKQNINDMDTDYNFHDMPGDDLGDANHKAELFDNFDENNSIIEGTLPEDAQDIDEQADIEETPQKEADSDEVQENKENPDTNDKTIAAIGILPARFN